MKYAAISDIHGNAPALHAVIRDAELRNVDCYLFLGDYYTDLHYPNEVVQTVRALKHVHVVRGNKEEVLRKLMGQDQSTWISEQFAPLYWNYRALEEENLRYLVNLPEEMTVLTKDGSHIHMTHSSDRLFPADVMKRLGTTAFALQMREKPFSHGEYLEDVRRLLAADEMLGKIVDDLPQGVYLFGHTHVQWHARIGKSWLVNPGSCGLPLDFQPEAAYTIVETCGNDTIIEEQRVPYDVEGTIQNLKNSSLYQAAKIWCDITVQELRTGEGIISFFLRYVDQTAREMGSPIRVCSNEAWHLAAERWFRRT